MPVDIVDDDSMPGLVNISSANKEGHRAVQAAKAGFFCSSELKVGKKKNVKSYFPW